MRSTDRLRPLTYLVCIFSFVTAILLGVGSVLDVHGVSLLKKVAAHEFKDAPSMRASLHATAVDITLVHSLVVIFYILSCLSVLLWMYESFKILQTIKTRPLDITPGWAVGWWFVPIANFVMPCRAMLELWIGSDSSEDWIRTGFTIPVRIWWTLWLLGNFVTVFAGFFRGTSHELSRYASYLELLASAKLAHVFGALMLVYVVIRIFKMQSITIQNREEQSDMAIGNAE
ncbi:MAG: hypothetical protein OJF61_000259 [Rhodanobacteraceae bacterium]|jgi:hypothetical protein|nr:MAG: hypothetical protein OJF61_000259 [Rhodanobacteraceae bacterium]